MLGTEAIEAIRAVRSEFGIGLKEGRDLWDQYRDVAMMRAACASDIPPEPPGKRIARLEAALRAVEAHHVEQNRLKGRDESRSTTLRLVREALK